MNWHTDTLAGGLEFREMRTIHADSLSDKTDSRSGTRLYLSRSFVLMPEAVNCIFCVPARVHFFRSHLFVANRLMN